MSEQRSRVTTHVLDAVAGRPAVGVGVELEHRAASGWELVGSSRTDDDGRVADLSPVDLDPGTYRIRFDTGTFFAAAAVPTFYPEVTLTFLIDDPAAHYHVPLLLSPYAFSTYRGS